MGDSVLVVNAGGTIGMVGTPHGYAPVPGALGPYLEWIVENSRGELAPITFLELDPPIDSANATPDSWRQIASILFQRRSDHAGFVVLHGTDTMAYTSSALSFLLPSFGKPVVVTGSQIPIARIRSDGRQNFIGALEVAADGGIPEVTLLFGDTVLDHAFTDLVRDPDGRARVALRSPAGTGVGLWADEHFSWLQAYTGDDQPPDTARTALAVEPMTAPPDAFNSGDDLVVLDPGATFSAGWGIRGLD